LTRDQLDKKSRISDELAVEIRRLESEMLQRSKQFQESSDALNATKAELRAAGKVSANERSQFVEEAAALREKSEQAEAQVVSLESQHAEAIAQAAALSAQLKQQEAATKAAMSSSREDQWLQERVGLAEQLAAESAEVFRVRTVFEEKAARAQEVEASSHAELVTLRQGLDAAREELQTQAKEHQDELARFNMQAARLRADAARDVSDALKRGEEMQARREASLGSPIGGDAEVSTIARLENEVEGLRKEVAAAADRESKLQQLLDQEREINDESARQLQVLRKEGSADAQALAQELEQLSGAMEEREEEMMDIQFSMAELQNRLKDQFVLVGENADAFQQASEELADKDEKLTKAVEEQEAMVASMNDITEKLQAKIQSLSTELENRKESYRTLEEQTGRLLKKVEEDRDSLASELTRLRAEDARDISDLRAEVERTQAAANVLATELQTSKANAAALHEEWDSRLRQTVALSDAKLREVEAQAECREAELQEELRSLTARHALSARNAQERERVLMLEKNAHAAAAQEWSSQLAQAMQSASQQKAYLEGQLSEERASNARMTVELNGAHEGSSRSPSKQPPAQDAEVMLKQRADECEKLRNLAHVHALKARQDKEELQALIGVEKDRAGQFSAKLSDTQEQVVALTYKLNSAEAQVMELTASLDRSRLLERQALDRAQEYHSSLQLFREFGHEDFMAAAPRAESMHDDSVVIDDFPIRREPSLVDGELRPAVPQVLMSVELDLGGRTEKGGKKATLTIAPWQTRADFDQVVQTFLQENRVRPVFADSLVRYLEQLEADASTFPVRVSGSLGDIYNKYFQ